MKYLPHTIIILTITLLAGFVYVSFIPTNVVHTVFPTIQKTIKDSINNTPLERRCFDANNVPINCKG